MTLSKEDLENTLITLANTPAQRNASLGYLPAILFAKWAADKADEPGFPESIGLKEKPVYNTDLSPKELISQVIENPILYPADDTVIETPKDARHHFEVLKHTIKTLGIFQTGDMKAEDIQNAFDAYLNRMFIESRENINTFQPFAADIVQQIAGKTEEAYDPFCKTGELLCAVDADKRIGSEPFKPMSTIAYIRSCFRGKRIELADDPISAPLTNEDGTLRRFPLVVSNIDHDVSHKQQEKNPAVSMDIYGRFALCHETDVLNSTVMLLHSLACTADSGRCIMVSPSFLNGGFRFMKPAESVQLLENDWLEAVIQIRGNENPRFRFSSLPHEMQIMVFSKNKDQNRKGKILFINDESEYSKEAVEKVCKAFHDFQEISGYSKIVELKDILKSRKPDLNPKSHTAVLEVPMALDLEEARQELIKIEGKRLAVLTDILDLLEEMKTE